MGNCIQKQEHTLVHDINSDSKNDKLINNEKENSCGFCAGTGYIIIGFNAFNINLGKRYYLSL